jgi:hypothetical protein
VQANACRWWRVDRVLPKPATGDFSIEGAPPFKQMRPHSPSQGRGEYGAAIKKAVGPLPAPGAMSQRDVSDICIRFLDTLFRW